MDAGASSNRSKLVNSILDNFESDFSERQVLPTQPILKRFHQHIFAHLHYIICHRHRIRLHVDIDWTHHLTAIAQRHIYSTCTRRAQSVHMNGRVTGIEEFVDSATFFVRLKHSNSRAHRFNCAMAFVFRVMYTSFMRFAIRGGRRRRSSDSPSFASSPFECTINRFAFLFTFGRPPRCVCDDEDCCCLFTFDSFVGGIDEDSSLICCIFSCAPSDCVTRTTQNRPWECSRRSRTDSGAHL